jgi:hypothetical protein
MTLAVSSSRPLPCRATCSDDVAATSRADADLCVAGGQIICRARPSLVRDPADLDEDFVHPGQNGSIFPAGQIPALARCPTEALVDRDRLRARGERSLEIVSSHRHAPTTAGSRRALPRLDAPRSRGAA